jgi:hypothetical protein
MCFGFNKPVKFRFEPVHFYKITAVKSFVANAQHIFEKLRCFKRFDAQTQQPLSWYILDGQFNLKNEHKIMSKITHKYALYCQIPAPRHWA